MTPTILLCEPLSNTSKWIAAFKALPATLITMPLLEKQTLSFASEWHTIIRHWQPSDWFLFTSQQAIASLLEDQDSYHWFKEREHVNVAVVGPKTQATWQEYHIPSTLFLPEQYDVQHASAALLQQLQSQHQSKQQPLPQIIWPSGEFANRSWLPRMNEAGLTVNALTVYTTKPLLPETHPKLKAALNTLAQQPEIHWLILNNPNAITHLSQWYHPAPETKILCLGPSSAERCQAVFSRSAHVPAPQTLEGIISYLRQSIQ